MRADSRSMTRGIQARPRCAFAGLGGRGRRLLARVAPSFGIVALVGTGRPESVAWSAWNYPEVPYFDTLKKALALPALDAVFLATPTRPAPPPSAMRPCAPGLVHGRGRETHGRGRWQRLRRPSARLCASDLAFQDACSLSSSPSSPGSDSGWVSDGRATDIVKSLHANACRN